MNTQPKGGIIGWFAANSVAANLLMVSMLVLGVMSLGSLRKEAFPSIEPSFVTVTVNYDSGDAKQAEEGIAIKIEEALETVPGIKRITSTSHANGSTVSIEKLADYKLDTLLSDVKTKVDAIYNFPVEAEKPIIDKATRQDHAIWVQLYGEADRASLQQLAERLKMDLAARSAIRDLEIKGKAEPMMSVEVDEGKLQAYGLTMTDVANAINAESSTSLTTSLRNGEKVLRLKASEQAYRAAEFDRIPLITTDKGTIITLGDVASIEDTFADDTFVLSRYNQQNGIGIEIVMDENGDITNIVEQARQVVDEWHQRGLLPQGVELETWYDKSVMIKDRLSLLTENALTGIALVFVVLALFLNIRVAFWVAAGLPFVFFGTLYFMTDTYIGLTINEMTTFGFIMALGIVVDDAVVVGESVYTTRREDGDTLANTIKGTMKVAVPTLFGVLTTVVAFLCMANVSGKLGQIYAQFGSIVAICLLLSVVESKLILPAHLAHLNTRREMAKKAGNLWTRIQHGADSGLQWFNQTVYCRVIAFALQMRYAVVFIFIAFLLLVMGMPMTGKIGVSFFPDVASDVVTASVTMQNDASFGQTQKNLNLLEQTAQEADNYLMNENGAEGTAIKSLQIVAEEDRAGQLTLELDPDAPYVSSEFVDKWRALSGSPEGIKQLKILASKEIVENFKLELKAWDDATLLAAGEKVKQLLQQTPGVSGIDDNFNPGQPQLRFELTEQGRTLGMDTATLSRQLLQSFGGEVVQRYQRDKDEVKVRVRYPEQARQTLADIMQARVRTPDGTVVPLSSVAYVITEYQKDEITRIDGLRAVYLTAVVDKSVIAANELVAQIQRDLVPELKLQYPDLSIHFAGEAEQQTETMGSMKSMFIVALLAIYVLLAVPLKSYIQPVLIMTAIPFGIVGAILGHWWNDLTISLLSLNGILALSGVVVNDSLLLVSRFNELTKQGLKVKKAVVTACSGRLRAVLLTSITTFAGLAPLLGETSTQAQLLIPAAASLGYGILFATLITLILIPALLMIQNDIRHLLAKLVTIVKSETKTVELC